jgi:hypothetical protein
LLSKTYINELRQHNLAFVLRCGGLRHCLSMDIHSGEQMNLPRCTPAYMPSLISSTAATKPGHGGIPSATPDRRRILVHHSQKEQT